MLPARAAPGGTGIQWGGVALAVAAGGGILWAAAPIGDAARPWLFLLGLLLGAAFVTFDYGFTAGIARFATAGDGRDLAASFIVPAVAALVVLPVGALDDGYGRFVTPIGLPLVGGAFIFGIGMQLAGACGSGCLVATGQGSRRIWVALPMFCLGGVAGLDLSRLEFWADPGARQLLDGPVFTLHGSLTDAAILIGALLAAALGGTLRHARRPLGQTSPRQNSPRQPSAAC